MMIASQVVFVLTLLLCGGYAGLVLMCQIGILPAMRDLRPAAFADAWRAMDSYMERAMPPYKLTLLVLNAASLVLLALQHRRALACALAVSFVCSAAGLVLTVRRQVPLNAQLKSPALPEETLIVIRERTTAGMRLRLVLATLAFVALSVGAVFFPVAA